MTTMIAPKTRNSLDKLLAQASESHAAIQITGRRHNGYLISEEDFIAISETLHLLSIPGMKESLVKARKAPLKSYTKKRPW